MSGSERKVLNKYYPPDYDPSKLPKLKLAKNRQYVIRVMAPFNMRCNVCGEYIYKGKKFNARRETVQDETYLGLWIFRFYIRCTRCISEITFKTDLKNCDYACEAGATRLFEAEKLARENAELEAKQKEQDDLNPMKVLENRTKDSRKEMVIMESLEELKELNTRYASIDKLNDTMIGMVNKEAELRRKKEQEEEEELIRAVLHKGESTGSTADGTVIKRLQESDSSDEDDKDGKKTSMGKQNVKMLKASDLILDDDHTSQKYGSEEQGSAAAGRGPTKTSGGNNSWERSVGSISSSANGGMSLRTGRSALSGLVKLKPSTSGAAAAAAAVGGDLELAAGSSTSAAEQPQAAGTGLGLLGDYSDSGGSSCSDGD